MSKLSKRQHARAQRIERAIASVDKSIRCTSATMRSALTAEEWEGYKASAAILLGPVLTGSARTRFARYKQCLRRGDAIYARAMKLSLVGPQALGRLRLAREAERQYCVAWETLEQLLVENAFVQMLLDRPFQECSPDREDIARPLTLTSEFAVQDDRSKRLMVLRCQRSALLASLSSLLQNEVVISVIAQEHVPASWMLDESPLTHIAASLQWGGSETM
jgi:hypothetical protein